MMAVDLHSGQLSLPSQLFPDKEDDAVGVLGQDQNLSNNNNDKDDDFITELTRQMAHFMFQDDEKLDLRTIASHNLEMSWDTIDSPQSTLWSPNQGSPDGPSQEPSPPATPGTGRDSSSCPECSSYDTIKMFEKMNLDDYERGHTKFQHGFRIQSLNNSNVGWRSNQALIDQQIRAIQLSRMKQVLKQNPTTAYRERQGQKPQQSEPKQKIQQFQKKGKGNNGNNGRRNGAPALFSSSIQSHQQQQDGSGMRAVFLGGSGSRSGSCGTGVFLPRGTNAAPCESRKRPGCSTVLIPARVVQALQLHFDQMAATSGPKAGGFPPLHDVLVSNRDGMYSLQKRQSRKSTADIQNEMVLPQEWTY